jgi:hypothetical protein
MYCRAALRSWTAQIAQDGSRVGSHHGSTPETPRANLGAVSVARADLVHLVHEVHHQDHADTSP